MDSDYLIHEFLRLEEAADFLSVKPSAVIRLLIEDHAVDAVLLSGSGRPVPLRWGNLVTRVILPDGRVVSSTDGAALGSLGFTLDQLILAKAWLAERGHKAVVNPPKKVELLAGETPEQRRTRRLLDFRALGGEIVRYGNGHRNAGTRGALMGLAKRESARGMPQSSRQDVRREVIKAWEDEKGG